jgi:DNA polymerase
LRLAYLRAMGIDVWTPRTSVAVAKVDANDPDFIQVAPVSAAAPLETRARASLGRSSTGGDGDRTTVSSELIPNPPIADTVQLDWSALKARVSACTLCGLHTTRTQTVFGVGSQTADWLFIGEAPGAEEDRQGEPFVGRAGQLLNNMLRAMGLSRERVYIANILKCRPPRNRDPRPEEALTCQPYLRRQIDLLCPKIIIALGRIAAQNLLNTDTPIGRMRGRRYVYADTSIPLLVTYHPAYLLRSPAEKRKAWGDLLLAQELVKTG